MDFVEIARCNQGPDRRNHAVFRRDAPRVRGDGTFRYRKAYRGLAPANFPERFDDFQSLSGAFADEGRVVRGSFRETIASRESSLRCRVRLRFRATRVRGR